MNITFISSRLILSSRFLYLSSCLYGSTFMTPKVLSSLNKTCSKVVQVQELYKKNLKLSDS